jgi:hypothetical protein
MANVPLGRPTDHGRSLAKLHLGNLAQRYLGTARSHERHGLQCVEVIAVILKITDVDRVAFLPLNRRRDVFAADARRDRQLDVIDSEPVASSGVASDHDVECKNPATLSLRRPPRFLLQGTISLRLPNRSAGFH